MMKKFSRKGKKRIHYYSKSDLNRLIDSILHPLAKGKNEVSILILDECLHFLVEQNPTLSLQKFIKYTLPKIVKKYYKETKG